jgi:hypothetical protein
MEASTATPAAPATPALSLIVATTHGWPGYRDVFLTHRAAVNAVGGEMIVADSSGNPAPAASEVGPQVTWLSAPGEGVFRLRARAYPVTRGTIVAHTEDHVVIAPDWAVIALDLHRQLPQAAVIGSVVENGSRKELNAWANFFVGHLWDMPSVGQAHRVEAAGMTCITYKRHAIEGMTAVGELGVNETFHQRLLSKAGEIVLLDDRLRCSHIQSDGVRRMVGRTWHAARAGAAMRRQKLTPKQVLRIALTPVLPVVYSAAIARQVAARRYYPGRALASAPWMLGFLGVRTVAELVGYVAGIGDSASKFD